MAMKLLKLLFLLSITISIVAAASDADEKKEAAPGAGAAWSADGKGQNSITDSHLALPESPENYIELPESEESSTSSSDGASDHFGFPQRKKTCDLFPQICHKKHSPGPDCCFRKCVNVMKDPLNCGMCGCKCKHNEQCCRGRCVNTSSDPRNCGSCGNKCKKWEACIYGMCSYA